MGTFPGAFRGKAHGTQNVPWLPLIFENDRFDYGEVRYVTLGLLQGVPVSIVHTETPDRIQIISFRKATKHEQAIVFQSV